MICDDCIHNAVCERAHFENHCGYKHAESEFDKALKALEDIKIISGALIGICEYECCAYGEEEALALAEKYVEDKE